MPEDQNVDPAVLGFMRTRRSTPWNMLASPAPGREETAALLEIAARVPDHGMLVPWRFIVLEGTAPKRLGQMALERGRALGIDPEKYRKTGRAFAGAPMIVAVVFTPRPSDKAPEWEQRLANGAVCLNLLNAAAAAGWGANWLTGWAARDRAFLENGLGLSSEEDISGFIHIGTPVSRPDERKRPDIDAITTWLST